MLLFPFNDKWLPIGSWLHDQNEDAESAASSLGAPFDADEETDAPRAPRRRLVCRGPHGDYMAISYRLLKEIGPTMSAGGDWHRDGARRSAALARQLRRVGQCDEPVGRLPMVVKLK